jgi:hypothetical protein
MNSLVLVSCIMVLWWVTNFLWHLLLRCWFGVTSHIIMKFEQWGFFEITPKKDLFFFSLLILSRVCLSFFRLHGCLELPMLQSWLTYPFEECFCATYGLFMKGSDSSPEAPTWVKVWGRYKQRQAFLRKCGEAASKPRPSDLVRHLSSLH